MGKELQLENHFLRTAIYAAYPVIISVNLTKDSYNCFTKEHKSYRFDKEGQYTKLVENGMKSIYPSYREDFEYTFSVPNILKSFENGERELYMEFKVMDTAGEYHWVSYHLVSVDNPPDEEEDVLAVVLIKLLDEQRAEKARQEQLLRDALAAAKAASHAKSDFLSRMSHDIRTPMNVILGMCAIGQHKPEDIETVKNCFEKIDTSSQSLLKLLNEILDMSMIEMSKMEMVNEAISLQKMSEELNRIILPEAEAKDIAYTAVVQEPLERYYIGDSLRIKQVIMNLLSNALKFTPAGGRVRIDISEKEKINGYAYIQIEIQDTGVGMSEEFMQRIFQPFEQEESGEVKGNSGSGLGLSIAYSLVQLMGGSISVKSKRNIGSTFTVILPLGLVSAEEQKEWEWKQNNFVQEVRQTEAGEKRILLVEDNELNLEIAQTLLEMNGFIVDTAENGTEAVEKFQNKALGYYHAILMDIRMPVMDGLEATRRIRALNRTDAGEVPILAMTANAFEQDKKEAYEAGMSNYLVKPLDVDEMIKALDL